MNVDDDEDDVQSLSTMAVPSPPITASVNPIWVTDTGPVDQENYPLFPFINLPQGTSIPRRLSAATCSADSWNRNSTQTNQMLKGFLDDEHCPQQNALLKPGINQFENDALKFYGLLDSIRPDHYEQSLKESEGMLWISGSIVATKEKADHPSIDADDPLVNLHTPGYFRKGEMVIFALNKEGLEARRSNPTLVPVGRGTIITGRNSKWIEVLSNNQTPRQSQDLDRNSVRRTPSVRAHRRRGNQAHHSRRGRNHRGRINNQTHHLNRALYNVRREEKVVPSALSKLFLIKSTPESVFLTWKLMDVFKEMGYHFDWLILNIIADHLPLGYQRDVYFNGNLFETMLHHKRQSLQNSDVHKIAEEFNRKWTHKTRVWADDAYYYKRKIQHIANLQLASIPRHPLLSQDPHLPQITPSGRDHIGILVKRLNIALKPTTNLSGYQLHTVLWCHELERSILAKQSLCVGSDDLLFCRGSNFAVYFKYVKGNGSYTPARKAKAIAPRIVQYGGGIISDDIGLGKTLTMLSLIAAHPHRDDITVDSFLPNSETLEVGPNGDTLRCAATLVVAPKDQIDQWKEDIDQHFKGNILNVLMIRTEREHHNITYRDILKAHVVLVSASFLSGFGYLHALESQPERREEHLQSVKATVKQRNLALMAPYLDVFHWKRFILDDGHQLLLNARVDSHISSIECDFKWYSTGTPFSNDTVMKCAGDFLNIRVNSKQKPSISVLQNVIYHHLYSRHTKESIAAKIHILSDAKEQETKGRNEMAREQEATKRSGDVAQRCELKMAYRTRDEIDFFLNIRDYAKEAMESSNSNSSIKQNGNSAALQKRTQSDWLKQKRKAER